MRIAYLLAGAGRMHCGACSHDYLFVSHLRHLAHAVTPVPLYTPAWSDLGELPDHPQVFLGGVSLYLRATRPGLAKAIAPLRPILDSRPVLSLATRRVIQTDPKELGPLTVSVLQGLDGPHAQEFERLLAYLQNTVRPDVVILANTLFAPVASAVRDRLKVPVLAHFQGEDSFVLDLPSGHREETIALLRQSAKAISMVLCSSESGVQQASILLELPREQCVVIPAPIDPAPYAGRLAPAAQPVTIGYLSVIRPAKGLDLLLRAMQQVGDLTTEPLRLVIAGQVLDAEYYKEMRTLAETLSPRIEVQFGGEVTFEEKVQLLQHCHLFCLPTRLPEARAMAAMEAMACGVPVVAPRLGVLPELLSPGGGFPFEPGSVDSLAHVLRNAIANPKDLAVASTHAQTTIQTRHIPAEVVAQLDNLLLRYQPASSVLDHAGDDVRWP